MMDGLKEARVQFKIQNQFLESERSELHFHILNLKKKIGWALKS